MRAEARQRPCAGGVPSPRIYRRFGWAVFDQGLSSLSNFALALAVARFVTTKSFGAYGIATAGYFLALGLSRSLTSEPFVVRYTAAKAEAFAEGARAAAGTSLTVGLVCSAVMAVVAGTAGPPLMRAMLAIAAVLPFLLVQDMGRYVLIARGDARRAAVNDGIWLLLQLIGTAVLISNRQLVHSLAGWVLMWGACGAVGAIVGMFQCALIPRVDKVGMWRHTEGSIMWRFLVESMITFWWAPITLLALAAVSGLAAAASLRGAQTVFGPLFVIGAGCMGALLPEGIRVLEVSPGRVTRLLVLSSASLALASVLGTAALLLMPAKTGRAILGDTWNGTHRIVLLYGLGMAASALGIGAATGLRVLQAISTSLRCRLATAPPLFIGPIIGAFVGGTSGFALGFLCAACLQAVILWCGFARASSARGKLLRAMSESARSVTDVRAKLGADAGAEVAL